MQCTSKHPETGIQCDRVAGHKGQHTADVSYSWGDPPTCDSAFRIGEVFMGIDKRIYVLTAIRHDQQRPLQSKCLSEDRSSCDDGVWHRYDFAKTRNLPKLPILDGTDFEMKWEFRPPLSDDWYVSVISGGPVKSSCDCDPGEERWILRKKAPAPKFKIGDWVIFVDVGDGTCFARPAQVKTILPSQKYELKFEGWTSTQNHDEKNLQALPPKPVFTDCGWKLTGEVGIPPKGQGYVGLYGSIKESCDAGPSSDKTYGKYRWFVECSYRPLKGYAEAEQFVHDTITDTRTGKTVQWGAQAFGILIDTGTYVPYSEAFKRFKRRDGQPFGVPA